MHNIACECVTYDTKMYLAVLPASIVTGAILPQEGVLSRAPQFSDLRNSQLHNSLAGGKAEQGGMDEVLLRAPPLDPDPPLDP
jgi:hypothetical protein